PLSMAEMLQLGHKFVGLPYLWAGDSTFGYDCSGIVQAMYAQMGVTLPRDGKQQAGWPGFYQVAEKDLKPGDALYFGWNNDISHAGLYLGNHKFLNSTAYQDPTVHISDLRAPHWRDIYITARRLKPNWRQYQGHGLAAAADFKATTQPLPAAVKQQMQKYTWHKGCPVPLSNLAYLQLSYWGFDNQAHQGALIVNKNLAPEITTIFKDLYQHKFPIAKMKPMYLYHGNDQVSMRANNTSAFNCRAQTNFSKIFSIHSYGGAIDINPLINPYVYGNKVEPAAAKKYLGKNVKGSITPNGIVVKDFTKKGWVWGGSWTGKVRDYQHFEKPLGS
ncbi:MAG: C40 family peptidase, partial [Gammaproteobacteria bacterium]|nr:C40 family peptidase [Gammaproteobacteria bacterium]